ncbi:hypothetical protein EZY14_019935 [Kordia sp. TARA_039_SRF]|jgi:hypothetical protein|nr:hypothetical protein EZY14_019935 [Kordia sp. TARA_039_SRF]
MKRKNLKSLKLNKQAISNFKQEKLVGAAPNTKTYCKCEAEPAEPLSIETICWGPSGILQCGADY